MVSMIYVDIAYHMLTQTESRLMSKEKILTDTGRPSALLIIKPTL